MLLQTARLEATNMNKSRSLGCNILFDTGSQRTYISRKFKMKLEAKMHHKESLMIGGFGGSITSVKEYVVVKFLLTDKEGKEEIKIQAVVVEKICGRLQVPSICTDEYEDFKDVPFVETTGADINVLIGIDHYYDIFKGEVIKSEGLSAAATQFGYVLSGCYEGKADTTVMTTHVLFCNDLSKEKMANFWDLETIGIKEDEEDEMKFDLKIEKEADKYSVNLPWKSHVILDDNYTLAMKRLKSLLKRLKRDPEMAKAYVEIMEDQEKKGIIEEVAENVDTMGKIYYMPHQPVVRADKKTSKVRIVYDASSKQVGSSLNECLQKGDVNLVNLIGVILRFRCHTIGVVADIEKAFLSIGVKKDDRDALRFLWVSDPFQDNPLVRIMRFNVVCFGVICICSMSILDETVRQHLEKVKDMYPYFVKIIRESMYIDDFSGGEKSRERCLDLYHHVKKIFQEANMNIRKWMSNNKDVQEEIDKLEGTLVPNTDEITKILGISWNTSEDEFEFDLSSITEKVVCKSPTKRDLLSVIASVFDPLGMLSPITVKLKMLFQKACGGNDWDTELSDDLLKEWRRWIENVNEFLLNVPRRYFLIEDVVKVSLVGFCDASEGAYAAVVYVVGENAAGEKESKIVMCKTRVSPIKKQSIPRLELLGALILSRLMKRVNEELEKVLELDEIICLTDSEVVLNWIQKNREYKMYVQNRVEEVRRNTSVDSWYHVPGDENIADLPSRGCVPSHLMKLEVMNRWKFGPSWMKKDKSEWPIRQDVKIVMVDNSELKKKSVDPEQ